MWSSTLFFRAGLALLSFSLTIHSTTALADTWSIDTDCNKNGNGGGNFTDSLGAVWEVKCAMSLSGYSFWDDGSNTQGVYACFKACDNRPQCTGFVYIGNEGVGVGSTGVTGQHFVVLPSQNQHITNLPAGPTTGGGRCHFRTDSGRFIARTDTKQYAAARLISPPGTTSPPGTVQRLVRATNPQNKMFMLTCT
jgi:hypothetical protein